MAKRKQGFNYNSKIKNLAKQLTIEQELSARAISKKLGSKGPHHATISAWQKKKDPETGLSWLDELSQKRKRDYEDLSPKSQMYNILTRISVILNAPIPQDGSPETLKAISQQADSLSKLRKLVETIYDKKFQIPMMYELLTMQINFFKLHYPKLVTKDFLNAVRHFKNSLKDEFELGIKKITQL